MLEENPLYQMLLAIEPDATFLADKDRDLIFVYKTTVDTGGELPPNAAKEIQRIYKSLQAEHTAMSFEAPALTMAKVVMDLKGTQLMMSPQEKAFVAYCEGKLRQREKLTGQETEALLRLYSNKGF
jgi:hypothetical protein